jgi:hypothetical protein
MRKAVASLFLSLDSAAEQSDLLVTVVDDAMNAHLKGVSR